MWIHSTPLFISLGKGKWVNVSKEVRKLSFFCSRALSRFLIEIKLSNMGEWDGKSLCQNKQDTQVNTHTHSGRKKVRFIVVKCRTYWEKASQSGKMFFTNDQTFCLFSLSTLLCMFWCTGYILMHSGWGCSQCQKSRTPTCQQNSSTNRRVTLRKQMLHDSITTEKIHCSGS